MSRDGIRRATEEDLALILEIERLSFEKQWEEGSDPAL